MNVNEDDEIIEQPATADETSARHVALRIRRKLPGRRIDKYLQGRFPHLSRAAVQRYIKDGTIKVNGRPTKASYEMCTGDLVEMTIPEPTPLEVIPQEMPIEVVYEDEYIIAVNKRAGVVCHPAHAEQTGTLVNGLVHYAMQKAGTLSHGSAPYRPGVIHRLDKNTTGVMLIAKQDEAHWRLALQFEHRSVQKTYLAVVHGEIPLDGDTIDAPIGVHPVVREKFAVLVLENKINIAKNAVTAYEVAERFKGYTLVKLLPKTGRTHQLRVHMSYIGFPIVGDKMYGGRAISEHTIADSGSTTPIFEFQALHAWRLRVKHPISEQYMEFEAPFHDAFKQLMNLLRTHRAIG